jgi:hypothetical protein
MSTQKAIRASSEHAVKADVALSYIPAILFHLDSDTRLMFAEVMQATREGGYEEGFRDGFTEASKDRKE